VIKPCNFYNFMGNANENLLKHLDLALKQLNEFSTRGIYAIEDDVFEVLDKISALLLESSFRDHSNNAVTMQDRCDPERDNKHDVPQYPISK